MAVGSRSLRKLFAMDEESELVPAGKVGCQYASSLQYSCNNHRWLISLRLGDGTCARTASTDNLRMVDTSETGQLGKKTFPESGPKVAQDSGAESKIDISQSGARRQWLYSYLSILWYLKKVQIFATYKNLGSSASHENSAGGDHIPIGSKLTPESFRIEISKLKNLMSSGLKGILKNNTLPSHRISTTL